MEDETLVVYRLVKGSNAPAGNGRSYRKKDGRGEDNSPDMSHGDLGRSCKGGKGYRRRRKKGIDEITECALISCEWLLSN